MIFTDLQFYVLKGTNMSKIIVFNSLSEVLLKNGQDCKGITFITSESTENYLSYKQLCERAKKILYNLQKAGLMPGSKLIFQLEDNEKYICTFWACLLGGIIPVPVSVGHNDEHRLKVIKIWGILDKPYIIVEQNVLNKLVEYGIANGFEKIVQQVLQKNIPLEHLDDDNGMGNIHISENQDTAFIQFSSGSTGEPKGVVLTHENLLTNVNDIITCSKLTSEDIVLSWMPLTHDMGMIGCHLVPLFLNIDQYSMPTSLFIRHPALWIKAVNQYRASILSSPNFGYRYFLSSLKHDIGEDWDLSCVKHIFNGAEPISYDLCKSFLLKMQKYNLKSTAMYPVYGLAEASLAVSFPPVGEEIIPVHINRSSISIGKAVKELSSSEEAGCVTFLDLGYPVTNCSLRICDEQNNILPENTVGLIQIKGKNVTKGYYNNMKDTDRLISSDGWLNTGDLGFLRNGRLVVTGRAKDIIFVNGQNFYPHDLERIAEGVADVRLGEVVVCSVPGVLNEEEILCFVLFKKGLDKFVQIAIDLKKHINKQTGLEVKYVLPVKKIPKTTSGKVQRYKFAIKFQSGEFDEIANQLDALIDKVSANSLEDTDMNNTEQRLASIWRDVLGIKKVSSNSDFFELGGNSLRSSVLSNRILMEFEAKISVRQLIEKPNLRDMARLIEDSDKNYLDTIKCSDNMENYPLSSEQRRIFAINIINGESISYNITSAMYVLGKLDVLDLEDAFKSIISRHESIRTTFHLVDGLPVQNVHKDVDFKIDYLDISGENLDTMIDQFIVPFDFEKAPLLRVAVIKLTQEKHLLLIDIHHIISDGTSMGIIVSELVAHYGKSSIPVNPLQYKDYSVWQQNNLKNDSWKYQEEYWLNTFSDGVPVLDMPLDFERPAVKSFEGDKVIFEADEVLTGKLLKIASDTGTTLFMVLMSIYNILLSKYTEQEDIVVGTTIAGRNHPGLDKIIGMFVNTLAMRFKPLGSKTFMEFLNDVKENSLKAYENQNYPFDLLVNKLGVEKDLSRNPILDTVFQLQNMEIPEMKVDGFEFVPYKLNKNTSMFDFKLEAKQEGKIMRFELEYCTKLFSESTMEGLAKHYIKIANTVSEDITILIDNIKLLDESESMKSKLPELVEDLDIDFDFQLLN